MHAAANDARQLQPRIDGNDKQHNAEDDGGGGDRDDENLHQLACGSSICISSTLPVGIYTRTTLGVIGVGFRSLATAGKVYAAEVTDRKGDNFGSTVTSFYSAR